MSTMNGKVLAALGRDPKMGHREFRIAFLMMQEDGASFTQAEIAEILGCSSMTIERAVRRMREGGWLTVERQDRREPNTYDFHMPDRGAAHAQG